MRKYNTEIWEDGPEKRTILVITSEDVENFKNTYTKEGEDEFYDGEYIGVYQEATHIEVLILPIAYKETPNYHVDKFKGICKQHGGTIVYV